MTFTFKLEQADGTRPLRIARKTCSFGPWLLRGRPAKISSSHHYGGEPLDSPRVAVSLAKEFE
jgi:hypothetical protein